MTIRTRLTLWYAGVLFVFSAIIAGLTYHELVVEKRIPDATTSEESEGFGDAIQILLFCGAPAALIGLGGGWFLTRKALAPVSALCQAASQFHERTLHERLPRTGNGDELDRLAEVFNSMISRLESSFSQIREFTLHASHELKTPLTVMNGELETALRDANLSQNQRECILSQIEEIQRLAKIVDGLTLLTKAGAGQLQLKREPLELHELVREVFEDAQILAQAARVTVSLEACDNVTATGDRHRIRQLLLNLVDNAIKYNRPDGKVAIQLRRHEKPPCNPACEIIISNTGKGIAPELLPRVFEPFFRCDPSHDSSVEGCGLGLSICQLIAAAHDGTVELRSPPNCPTTATVRLPMAMKNDKVHPGQRHSIGIKTAN